MVHLAPKIIFHHELKQYGNSSLVRVHKSHEAVEIRRAFPPPLQQLCRVVFKGYFIKWRRRSFPSEGTHPNVFLSTAEDINCGIGDFHTFSGRNSAVNSSNDDQKRRK